jgi:hypothetical protein
LIVNYDKIGGLYLKLSVKDASKMMGVSPNLLRIIIREKKLPESVAFSIKNKNRFYYYINEKKFIEYLKSGSN